METLLQQVLAAIQSFAATKAGALMPSANALFIAFATIVLVWEGIKYQASLHFRLEDFLGVILKIGFVKWMLVTYNWFTKDIILDGLMEYGKAIAPWDGGFNSLWNVMLGSEASVWKAIGFSGVGLLAAGLWIAMAIIFAIIVATIMFGFIGAAIFKIVGPIMIPFLLFKETDFLFYGWLKGFLTFCGYFLIVSAIIAMLTVDAIANLFLKSFSFENPSSIVYLLVYQVVILYALLRTHTMASQLFGGR